VRTGDDLEPMFGFVGFLGGYAQLCDELGTRARSAGGMVVRGLARA